MHLMHLMHLMLMIWYVVLTCVVKMDFFFSFENGRIIYHDRLEIGESCCFTNYIMRHNLLVSSVYHHIQLCVASYYGMCFDKMNIVKAHEHLQQLLWIIIYRVYQSSTYIVDRCFHDYFVPHCCNESLREYIS